ncbi:hypothetical protein RQM59_08595 [Flavobacteriaceae bacterium S356]|uniref:DUF6602 domain-containing protein n=1 Tax=Asprobacillus argus TaxID=3076534 RepID=A0ABU3LFE5_9FLAO|nr:hypothetical protein [Flavobacteriaceae bacterium S356]
MPNQYVLQRLAGIRTILNGVHRASANMTNNTMGAEREAVIDFFLSAVFPNQFRFGTGDATDLEGNRSGQLDVVIESGVSPSLPTIPASNSKLYLAESVSAVIEVKSTISTQWQQAISTANQLSPLKRKFGANLSMGGKPTNDIPLFVVGYTGWNQMTSLENNITGAPNIDGILVIDQGLFLSSQRFGGVKATGDWALWGLICCLHQAVGTLKASSTKPINYAF